MRVLRREMVALLFFWATSLGATSTAAAYEGRYTLGLETGYSRVLLDTDAPEHGPLVGALGSVGLSDVWTLRGRLAYAFHPGERPLQLGLAGLEAIYLFDVLELVPYFGVGIDAITTAYDGSFGADFGAHVIVGLDYFLSWTWIVGLDVRPTFLIPPIGSGWLDPVYLSINLRLSYVFDR